MNIINSKAMQVTKFFADANFYISVMFLVYGGLTAITENYSIFQFNEDLFGAMHNNLRRVAEQAGIPLTEEWMPEDSGTEAADIQLTHRGVPTAVLSLPILHMHSPVEIVDPEDIRKTAGLLAKFLLSMTEPLYHRGRRV